MNIEEIYFLKKIGFPITDEKEIVTTDNIYHFPNIMTFIDEMARISGDNMNKYIILLKNTIYNSCMMYYTVNAYKKNIISEDIYNYVMRKSNKLLKSINSDFLISFTLLYEGPYYLHSETLSAYKNSGHQRITDLYIAVFENELKKAESQREYIFSNDIEKNAYMELYNNYIKEDFLEVQGYSDVKH